MMPVAAPERRGREVEKLLITGGYRKRARNCPCVFGFSPPGVE